MPEAIIKLIISVVIVSAALQFAFAMIRRAASKPPSGPDMLDALYRVGALTREQRKAARTLLHD